MNYANSLRVIGQSLDIGKVREFRLETQGQDYVVKSDYFGEEIEYFLKRAQVLYDSRKESHGNFPNNSIKLSFEDIARLNRLAQLQRNFSAYPSAHEHMKLSHLLRALGDFLDHKEAQAFQISWTDNSITVDFRSSTFQSESRMFTSERLHRLSSFGKFQVRRRFRYSIQPRNE